MNLASIIDDHPADNVALISRGRTTTYGELRRQVGELRGGLVRLGVEPGDRVALLSATNSTFALAYLAALGAGAVVVPLNPNSPPLELAREIKAVGATLAIAGPSGSEALGAMDQSAAGLARVVTDEPGRIAGAVSWGDLFGGEPTPIVDRDPDDLAVLIFTSGTGGSPKAAMLTHGNLLSNLVEVQAHPGRGLTAEDVSLGVLPLFHIFGLNVALGLTLYAGGSVVLVERFDPASALDTIADHGVTMVAGAPPMYATWTSFPNIDPAAMRSVRLAVSGAAPLPAEIGAEFQRRFGIPIWEGYGLTEASPIVTSSVIGGQAKPGSIGVPLPGIEVRLVDEEGEDALVGDEGEIWVRGPNVFKGYWGDEAATRRALTDDGWLRTGDIAVADDDGYLYIVDRAKDLIIVSGFNVYPAEVEEALLEHPGVAEVAVVGVAHPHTGEAVKAFVVASTGRNTDEDELIEFCASRLARYKCPTKVKFVPELPRGLGGKVLRRELRAS